MCKLYCNTIINKPTRKYYVAQLKGQQGSFSETHVIIYALHSGAHMTDNSTSFEKNSISEK